MRSKKPNVIWFLVDQMRTQAMSHTGDPNVNTPNLDRLATEGISFSKAVSGTPLCSPFRGSLITGKYPHQSTVPGLASPLSVDMRTIAHTLNEHDYRTCWIGKWHLDGSSPEAAPTLPESKPKIRRIPVERRGGFQDWWAYENNNNPFDCYVHTGANGQITSTRLPGYETDSLTDILIEYVTGRVAKSAAEPFFAVLSVQPPHNPYIAPAENMARYRPAALELRPNVPQIDRIVKEARRGLAGYYAAIERIDWNVGRIMQALRDLEIDKDTYLVFFSDHGDMLGSHGQFRKTVPWEESIRIPFIIGGGGLECQNNHPLELDEMLNHVDIAPTTLGLCGIAQPQGMAGFDYSRLILGEPLDRPTPDSAYLSLPLPSSFDYSVDRPYRGIVTRDGWKYIALEGQPWLMYNLNEDPYEQANLAMTNQYKDKKKQLQIRLQRWIEDTEDSFRLPD